MSEITDPQAWIARAEEDYVIARTALRRKRPLSPQHLNILSEHAVRTRYPGEDPSLGEGREAIKIAKAVRKFARNLLGIQ